MQTDPVKVTVRTPKGDTGERLVEFYDKKTGERGLISFVPPTKIIGHLTVKLLQADDNVEFAGFPGADSSPAETPAKAKKATKAA
jgi:hypothetical protein